MPRWLRGLTALSGRLLLSLIFLMSGMNKIVQWSSTAQYMASEGMVAIPFFLVAAIVVELLGGFSVLLGCYTRLGALLLLIYLIPVSLIFHDFWAYEGQEQMGQMIHFMKNISIMGAMLFLISQGAGAWSIDSKRRSELPETGE